MAQLPQPNPNADPAGPLFAQVVVFTGELSGLGREEAMQRVADAGGISANNITKKATMIVIGRLDNSTSRVEISTVSGKERKALQYIAAGQKIRAVSENEFVGWTNSGGSVGGSLTTDAKSVPSSQDQRTTSTDNKDSAGTTLLVETAISGLFKWIRGLRHEK
ncbi:BRCT domain-containing protein [Arthrobacter sp. CAL618]|uniref:BRCT domain-containing protein n=1 Tax=Arthrobacter sp. CAL618 TaxID=1055770 RepID=UPI0012EC93D8|nr:BRCT domain-containing protein [Arthrobacter sp. CAL618]